MGELTAQNPKSIRDMFGRISEKYDLANSILSFGIHHRWKKKLIRESHVRPGNKVLDCATGTGDLAFLFEKAMDRSGEIVGSDFCEPMLEVARKKTLGQEKALIRFEWADVTNLPYPTQYFDIASISFGIRNVQDPQKAISELGRVVKTGGRVLILEFGQPHSPLMTRLFGFYSNWILPTLGGWISGQSKAYRYLQTSSAAFPCRQEFLDIARSTGHFSEMKFLSFQGGIAYLYVLTRS